MTQIPDAFRAMQSPTILDVASIPLPSPCGLFEFTPRQYHSVKIRIYNCKKHKTREQVLAARRKNKANRKRSR